MLSVQHAQPSPQLTPFLYGYVQRVSEPHWPEIVEPVVGRSGSMLEFQFGDPYDVPVYGLDLPNPSVPVTVIGPMMSRRVRLIIQGRVEAFVVLFRPLGLYEIFGIPLAPLAGTGTEGGGVLGSAVERLYEQLGDLRSFIDRVSVVEAFLLQRLRRHRPLHPAHRALQALASSKAHVMVADLADQAGISTRQLERLSLDCCGVSPRMLARLTRFQRALKLRQRHGGSWTRIAHAANYHDQMHMIRDFRELAGSTPEQAIQEISADHLISFMCQ